MADDSSATYISELDNSFPDGSVDTMDKVDNQLRMLKTLLETTFSGFTDGEAVTLSEQQVNNLAFTTGTVVMFYQAAAPTGWTEATIQADSALRVVNLAGATGGTAGGTIGLSNSLAHTHTGPSHTHTIAHTHSLSATSGQGSTTIGMEDNYGTVPLTPGSHTHSVSGTTGASSAANSGSG
ncbi:MAG: hypothetical protein ACWGQW_08260, partial [bacterium]